jgi:hypothetical protein
VDPFRLCIALGPVAIYVLLLGTINLSRRPFLVTGMRDSGTLGLALSGLLIVGPIELFFPSALAARFGPYSWVMMAGMYVACLVPVLLLVRPRLVIYNISTDRLRPILAELVPQLDPDARWAGDSLALPRLGVQLHVDATSSMRNVSLSALGADQNQSGWRMLEHRLRDALSDAKFERNPRGISLIVFGLLILWVLCREIAIDPEMAYQALFKVFRL